MRSVDDTRGGIAEVAWCSSLQLKRKILPSGTVSRSYTAIRNARRDYCKELLNRLDDFKTFRQSEVAGCPGMSRIVLYRGLSDILQERY